MIEIRMVGGMHHVVGLRHSCSAGVKRRLLHITPGPSVENQEVLDEILERQQEQD
jgi:hypothetical protein